MKNKDTIKFELSTEFCIEKAEQYFEEGNYHIALSYLERIENRKLSKEQFATFCILKSYICHTFGIDGGNFWALEYLAKHGFDQDVYACVAGAKIVNEKDMPKTQALCESLGGEYEFGEDFDEERDGEFIRSLLEILEEEDYDFDNVEPKLKGKTAFNFSMEDRTPKRQIVPRSFFVLASDKIGFEAFENGSLNLQNGETETALEYFKQVPIDSKKYPDALSSIGLCHLFLGNYKKSYEINKMVLFEYPHILQSKLQLMSLCNILNKPVEFDDYLAMVLKEKYGPEDSLKIANILVDSELFQTAVPYFEYAFSELNYSLEGYMTYLITLHNAGKTELAIKKMKELAKIFPENALIWYHLSKMQRGEERITFQELFSETSEPCVEIGISFLKRADFGVDSLLDKRRRAFIFYACGKSIKAVEYYGKIISATGGVQMLCSLLHHKSATSAMKNNALKALMLHNYKGKVLYCSGEYKYLNISYPTATKTSIKLFMAYAIAFAILADYCCDFETKLKRAVGVFVKNCKNQEVNWEEEMEPNMISALLVAKLKELPFEIICQTTSVELIAFLTKGAKIFGEEFARYHNDELHF